jgi:ADP-heptose:LPS heptosyltransferase
MHMASALGTPTVGIFAPGEPRRTFPQGVARWRVLAAIAPALISAADMLRAATELMESD